MKNALSAPDFARRFEEDDAFLRRSSFADNARGLNDSDYHNMYGLFLRVLRRIESLDDNNAIISQSGCDVKLLATWNALLDNARRMIEGLNKMRNSDRLVLHILESQTKSFAQAIASPLGVELREIVLELERIPEASHITARMKRLVGSGVSSMFRNAALETLARTREEYKLN